jgi:LPPG:FO 2-phospho-L-lactate transferase
MAMKIVALAGGVGGAKLAHGLAHRLRPDEFSVIVNTADDFTHLGLAISPDLDTVLYTLADLANPDTGWGRKDESWQALEIVEQLGGPKWFQLGDRDLGLHLDRTRRLGEGEKLSSITAEYASRFGVKHNLYPMSDDPVRTFVETDAGWLPFQEYFVKHGCRPAVRGFEFRGSKQASPAPGVIETIRQASLVVFCPSNPWVSLDPILSLPQIASAVSTKPVVGVSPIVAGQALRGPAANMYQQLGIEPSAVAVAEHFRSYLTAFVIDQQDEDLGYQIRELGLEVAVLDTIMRSVSDRERLAGEIIAYANELLQLEAGR